MNLVRVKLAVIVSAAGAAVFYALPRYYQPRVFHPGRRSVSPPRNAVGRIIPTDPSWATGLIPRLIHGSRLVLAVVATALWDSVNQNNNVRLEKHTCSAPA